MPKQFLQNMDILTTKKKMKKKNEKQRGKQVPYLDLTGNFVIRP